MSRRSNKKKPELVDVSDNGDASYAATKKARMSSSNRNKRLSLLVDYGASSEGRGKGAKQMPYPCFDRQREKRVSDEIVAKFEAKIERQAEAMREVIACEENKLNKRRQDITNKLVELYETVLPDETLNANGQRKSGLDSRKTSHILYQEAEAVTQRRRELINKFVKADEMVKTAKLKLPLDTWAKDKRDIADIMQCGRDYGQSIVEGLLAPGMYESPQARSRLADDDLDIAAQLFEKSKQALDEDNWGTVSEDQMKRCIVLANSVPGEAASAGQWTSRQDSI